MVNQNENQNEFVLVLGPYQPKRTSFCSSGESYQNEFHFRFRFGNHKDRPNDGSDWNPSSNCTPSPDPNRTPNPNPDCSPNPTLTRDPPGYFYPTPNPDPTPNPTKGPAHPRMPAHAGGTPRIRHVPRRALPLPLGRTPYTYP